jgi:ABC-type phosphate/phosphonate transport system permease subunit
VPLQIRGLSKQYTRGVTVLEGVSLDIEARGITAVIGPSGAGGIGLVLDAAINVFQWRAVAAVLVAVFAVVLFAEVAVTAIRKRVL